MRQVLITGATSLVGQRLARTLIEKNIPTRALVRHGAPEYGELKRLGVEVQSGDIRETKVADRAISGVDFVFNCVGNIAENASFTEWRQLTIEGTRNICRASAKENISRMVHLSTADIFGYRHKEIVTESSPIQFWGEAYPDTRIKIDEIVWLYRQEQYLPLTVVYPCKLFGEYDFGFIGSLALMIENSSMRYWKSEMKFFPLYIQNLVEFMIQVAVNDKAEGEGYIVHDSRPKTLKDFCDPIAKAMGHPIVRQRVTYSRALLAARFEENFAKFSRSSRQPIVTPYLVKSFNSSADLSMKKARTQLEWVPPISTLDGLSKVTDWLKRTDYETLKSHRQPVRF